MKRALAIDIASVVSLALVYVVIQLYVFLYPAYDYSTFLVGAVVPFSASILLGFLTRNRILLFTFLAYFWALVEDGPIFLDSVFTWPEVTRFNPAGPHIFLEVLYHLLTGIFLVLALREAMKGRTLSRLRFAGVFVLGLLALVLAYAQNIPLAVIQDFVENQWYLVNALEHTLSPLVLLLAIILASRAPSSEKLMP